jgi:hypothetical protein
MRTKIIYRAIEQANEDIGKVADGVINKYLDELHERYPNHMFAWQDAMGSRVLRVFRKVDRLLIIEASSFDCREPYYTGDHTKTYCSIKRWSETEIATELERFVTDLCCLLDTGTGYVPTYDIDLPDRFEHLEKP